MPFRDFTYKDSNFRILCSCFDVVVGEIRRQRSLLEAYIVRHPEFHTSMTPVGLLPDAPEIARRMTFAAAAVGVGPMAAVAGTIAQMAAEIAIDRGGRQVIVENGGDIFLAGTSPATVGLYAGPGRIGGRLAFAVTPEHLPLAICSSSSRMGHSTSLGDCDLATVVSQNASLADAAATHACNLVRSPQDIDKALECIASIKGVIGALIAKGERIGVIGDLPELVRNRDPAKNHKITRDRNSDIFEKPRS